MYAIVCLTVIWKDQSKTFEVTIMKFSPHGIPISLVLWASFTEKF